jgi:CopA family copper-resistance protein
LKTPVFHRVPALALLLAVAWPAWAGTYDLNIDEQRLSLGGRDNTAVLANGTLPGPTLRWREGEDVTLRVANRTAEPTSIHWHGLILPYEMDGVPGISFPGIAPGETFTYRFKLAQSGTYWYHGHSAFQEQLGLYGAIVVDPAKPEPFAYDRDYVVLLSDWTDHDPHRVLSRLKKQSDYYNFQKRTLFDFFRDLSGRGARETVADRLAWGDMRMDPTDLADVTGYAYTFLVNGRSPDAHWTALFQPGERVRLRFINGAAMTHFDVRIPGLALRVVQADGQAVASVTVDRFRIAVAETYDVIVEPKEHRAYTLFAEAMDRSGYARATLAPHPGMTAPVPEPSPRTLVTLAEMAAAHGGAHGDHGGPGAAGAETGHAGESTGHEGMGHAGMGHGSLAHDGMNHAGMDMDHAAMGHAPVQPAMDHAAHAGHAPPEPAAPASAERALSYRDLQRAEPDPGWHAPDREITLRLTGTMNRYIWSMDGIKFSEAEPIRLKYGERVRFKYVNETMMNHPIHLHGMWQDLDTGRGALNPRKHVINVRPGETVAVDVTADAPGAWAFHCHLLFHMETGMFRKVIVEPPTGERAS